MGDKRYARTTPRSIYVNTSRDLASREPAGREGCREKLDRRGVGRRGREGRRWRWRAARAMRRDRARGREEEAAEETVAGGREVRRGPSRARMRGGGWNEEGAKRSTVSSYA
jgi:hypothetical protein